MDGTFHEECERAIATLTSIPLTTQEWAKVWCRLNLGEWPEDVLGPFISEKVASELLMELISKITYKECLREWNKDTYPGEVFDKWWASRQLAHNVLSTVH